MKRLLISPRLRHAVAAATVSLLPLPAAAQQFLNMATPAGTANQHILDFNPAFNASNRLRYHAPLYLLHNVPLAPRWVPGQAEPQTEVAVAQLALGTDFSSWEQPDARDRYRSLLKPGVVHLGLSLIGGHYACCNGRVRAWVDLTAGLKLLRYKAAADTDTARNGPLFWQRYAGMGGGIALLNTAATSDLFAVNAQWIRAEHDVGPETRAYFREQFSTDLRGHYVDINARARLYPVDKTTVGKIPLQLNLTLAYRRFYADYGRPNLLLLGLSASVSFQ